MQLYSCLTLKDLVLCFLLFFPESEGYSPTHIVVLCRGRVFVFDAIHEGCLITPPEILRFFKLLS